MAKLSSLPYPSSGETTSMGEVKGRNGDTWVVDLGNRIVVAQCAFSCLVEPCSGDQVLLANHAGHCFIIAITARNSHVETQIRLGEGVNARASDGELAIDCHRHFEVHAKTHHMVQENLRIVSHNTDVISQETHVSGYSITSHFKSVKRVASTVLDICDYATRQLGNCFKQVSGVEQHKAKDALHTVENSLTVRSKHTSFTARKEMKIDGERIHMG